MITLLKRLLLVGAATVVAYFFCGWVTVAVGNRPSKVWTQLPTPEAPVVELVAVEAWTSAVFVRTVSDTIYRCSIEEGCSETVDVNPNSSDADCQIADLEAPPFPGTPVDSLEAYFCSDSSLQVNVVLLGNGTIWEWEHFQDWGLRCWLIIPAASGLLLCF